MIFKAKEIPKINDPSRFLSKVRVDQDSGCWLWSGCKNVKGYGQIYINGSTYTTHRVSYSLFKGQMDLEKVIDHVCRNKGCCNPDHIREVTYKINATENSIGISAKNKIKTHCHNGHEFTVENTAYYRATKVRHCRACAAQRGRNKKKYYEITIENLSGLVIEADSQGVSAEWKERARTALLEIRKLQESK